jgi:stage V sporulation protein AD
MSEQNLTTSKIAGKQSIIFKNPPLILSGSSIAGKKESEGPLGSFFDEIEEDPMAGGKSWEDAESRLMKRAAEKAIEKSGLTNQDIRFLIGGDLLGQLIATSFGIISLEIPMFGVYGACSTMGESMALGAILVDGGYADKVLAVTSSHFAGAEKQFRFPLAYGNQRPISASWTVTGSGAVIIGKNDTKDKNKQKNGDKNIVIKGVTIGKIEDYGLKDSMNMGACMAPSAYTTISQNLKDINQLPLYYDKIITGDLGYVGKDILIDLLKEDGFDISSNHMDCGIEIFDKDSQDTHNGGSGCGCSAITLTGLILQKMRRGEWNRVLFVPTGSLQSTVSFNEGNSIPGIAHGIILETLSH